MQKKIFESTLNFTQPSIRGIIKDFNIHFEHILIEIPLIVEKIRQIMRKCYDTFTSAKHGIEVKDQICVIFDNRNLPLNQICL